MNASISRGDTFLSDNKGGSGKSCRRLGSTPNCQEIHWRAYDGDQRDRDRRRLREEQIEISRRRDTKRDAHGYRERDSERERQRDI